ncbi:ATP-grasp fold subdomain 2 [Penicillium paradoxum]|uniref:ATP-grasp fold subdomain 2 n=1 Tax=Penicillium paradoxum TaxID=176176 RepID=UPI0025496D2E|nr:ATP-grasp fold subdomain 2 [Penicillium paradoxum]KAJ5793995.1 ATP-grasp fold subdomain 2 [Penicillium paradoxum]
MSYSSTAVRFFTAPKPLGDTMNANTTKNSESDSPAHAVVRPNLPTKQPSEEIAKPHTPKSQGLTFAHQDALPKLPIPDLEDTCRRHLEALRALQSPREHEDSKAAVRDFLKTDGPVLQERLKAYAGSKTSYIEQFWYDSYLNFDNPVVLNLNPFFLLEDDPTPARNHQVTRAASLAVSALAFVRAVRREELPADEVRGTPLCMYQYSRLFGTARVPTENGCIISQNPSAKHMVVMCRGQFYWFDVLDDNSDLIMSEKDISLNLQVIIEDATQTSIHHAAKGALGVLSTENRKVWSGLRDIMTKDPGSNNAECLNIVDTALFILCLDYTEPTTTAELCANMLCGTSEVIKGVQVGTCTNRWYDKLQIIVCKNGSAGINFEHTGVDGHTVLRFASDLYTDTILRFAKTINGRSPSLWATTSPDPSKRDPHSFGNVSTTPRKLEWDMTPELNIAIRFAESHLSDLLYQHEFQVLDFESFGKNFITSMGFSPDAFIQMAFQAAYYGLYGRLENTYEPAMTKMFLHGRTEAIRTVTPECLDFVTAFWGENSPDQKVDALRTACQKHTALTKECSKGQGPDRHLYALYCLWQRSFDEGVFLDSSSTGGYSSPGDSQSQTPSQGIESPRLSSPAPSEDSFSVGSSARYRTITAPTPAIFADAGWDKINTTVLSTSNCGNPCLRHFGFGPTSADGFGIGYIIKDDSISICASSKHRQTSRLMHTLEQYLFEIRKLLRATNHKTKSPRTSRARETEAMAESLQTDSNRRGRIVRGGGAHGADTPTSAAESSYLEDDGMGGYGFFDAGMLLHALKGLSAEREQRGEKPARRRGFTTTPLTAGYADTLPNLKIGAHTKVLFQGFTGRQATANVKESLEWGTKIVGGVKPGVEGEHLGLPIFPSVKAAQERAKPDASAIYVPGNQTAKAIEEAIEAEIPLVVAVAEHVPIHDILRIHSMLQTQSKTRLVGANCPGIISAIGKCRIGFQPLPCFAPGNVGIVAKSGTLSYETVASTTRAGLGQSLCISMGGDVLAGTNFVDALTIFENDPDTEGIILVGEIGGTAEMDAAEWIKDYRRRTVDPKPIMALVGGLEAPPGRIMGHAGAWVAPGEPDAEAKYQALERAGAVMVNHPEKFGEGMKILLANQSSRPGTNPISGTRSQKRGFHTMRRVTPTSRMTTEHKRSLYIKQFQAFDILKQKSVRVNESSSESDFSISITVDRTALSPCIIVAPTAKSEPARSLRIPFPYTQTKFNDSPIAATAASHLNLPASANKKVEELVQALWEIYKEKEAFVLETRVGISADGTLEVHSARFGFDDAAFRSSGRQEDIHKLRNISEEVPEEVEAEKDGIVYVKLEGEGSVGTLVNGAGLAMNTVDALTIHGGHCANFLDTGGKATSETVKSSFRVITSDERVKAVFVNIFGGLTRCDMIAEGIILAFRDLNMKVPVVVRLRGTNEELGQKMIAESGLPLHAFDGFEEAAKKVIALAKGQ